MQRLQLATHQTFSSLIFCCKQLLPCIFVGPLALASWDLTLIISWSQLVLSACSKPWWGWHMDFVTNQQLNMHERTWKLQHKGKPPVLFCTLLINVVADNTALISLDLIQLSSFISFIWPKSFTFSYCRLNSLVHPSCIQNTWMPPDHIWISTIWEWMEINKRLLMHGDHLKGLLINCLATHDTWQ